MPKAAALVMKFHSMVFLKDKYLNCQTIVRRFIFPRWDGWAALNSNYVIGPENDSKYWFNYLVELSWVGQTPPDPPSTSLGALCFTWASSSKLGRGACLNITWQRLVKLINDIISSRKKVRNTNEWTSTSCKLNVCSLRQALSLLSTPTLLLLNLSLACQVQANLVGA